MSKFFVSKKVTVTVGFSMVKTVGMWYSVPEYVTVFVSNFHCGI